MLIKHVKMLLSSKMLFLTKAFQPQPGPYTGVYAGDPSKLSMKAAFGKVWKLEQNGGSIIGGTIKALKDRSSSAKVPRDP